MRGVVGRTQSQAFEGVFGQSSQESRHVRVSWLSFSLVTFSSGSGFQPVFQVSQSAGRSKTRPLFYHGKRRSIASWVGHIVFVLDHRVALPLSSYRCSGSKGPQQNGTVLRAADDPTEAMTARDALVNLFECPHGPKPPSTEA